MCYGSRPVLPIGLYEVKLFCALHVLCSPLCFFSALNRFWRHVHHRLQRNGTSFIGWWSTTSTLLLVRQMARNLFLDSQKFHISRTNSPEMVLLQCLWQTVKAVNTYGFQQYIEVQFSSVVFNLFSSSQGKSQWKASLKRWVLSPVLEIL